ncbi:3'(2'),5'-bisphosphate nucleotidase CysQ [Sulfuriflexus mobilis]|uniref:3'(2'),5'-bisphosphate nucleotidase CysQ n=1 Tax=Sulfuriflexus mobilis TaxID=1811807 RepID=UPI000F82B450|nr:3'(2'),5'-bisphosphate nucleotidase CysQ [Sulfuriflexus mobilis]
MIQPDDKLLEDVMQLAVEAGHEILRIYETDYAIEHKDDKTPLTEADMAAHHIIDAGLQKLTPGIPILSEESAEIPFAERRQWSCYWLVDPLDGTREFIKRNGEFTVNIALIENGESVLGVVYAPVLKTSYYARRGAGAFRKENGKPAIPIQTRRPSASPVLVAGSRSHRGDSLNAYLECLADYEIISVGSSLKSCMVAEGSADIYPRLGPTSEWDTAAAQCVVEEAGGRLTDTRMQTLRYNTKDSLLNPHFFVFGDPDRDWSEYLED